MKRALVILSLLAACTTRNPYDQPMYYEQFLSPANHQDVGIQNALAAVRANPDNAALHNDLGVLLQAKGYPRDAEREFERAVNADSDFAPAWFNLGLVRAAKEDYSGSKRAFHQAVRHQPGHAAALFQIGLIEEHRKNPDAAVHYYSKAYGINPSLLDVRVNPRIVESKLTHLALLKIYPRTRARQTMGFQPTPSGYVSRDQRPEAPSRQAPASEIIPPAPPVTEQGTQTPAPAVTNT